MFILSHKHAYTHTYIHTYVHVRACAFAGALLQNPQMRAMMSDPNFLQQAMNPGAYAYMHTYTHTHIHSYTNTHTHLCIFICSYT